MTGNSEDNAPGDLGLADKLRTLAESLRKGRASALRKTHTLSFSDHGVLRRFQLGTGTTTIGRSKECGVPIRHKDVAPVHCRIERSTDGALVLFAVDDDHPVVVDGAPVEFLRLEGGETIRLGPASIRLSTGMSFIPEEEEIKAKFSHEANFGRVMVGSIKKTHWLALSCAFHFFLILFLSWLIRPDDFTGARVGFLQNGFIDDFSGVGFDETRQDKSKELEFDDPNESAIVDPDDMSAKELMAGKEDSFDPDRFGPLGQGGAGLDPGMYNETGKALKIGRGDGLFGKGTGWGEHVGTLRKSGLDIAILFDSTGSMVDFLTEVKATIGEMVKALHKIVPNLRISLITYKGDVDSSKYVVAGTPLVNDIFELLNFLNCVSTSGGSPEGYAAIEKAIRLSVKNLKWREGTKRRIVIIGDAPPFPDSHNEALSLIREFKGRLSLIYKDSTYTPANLTPETKSCFRMLAIAGKGEFLEYDGEGDVVRHIVTAVLGSEWTDNVNAVFDNKGKSPWKSVLHRKIKEKDIDWLMEQFAQYSVRPEAVDALVSVGGKEVAARIWDRVRTGCDSAWLLQRCIYVLTRLTDLHVDYIYSHRRSLNRTQLRYIEDVLTFVYGKNFYSKKKRPQ